MPGRNGFYFNGIDDTERAIHNAFDKNGSLTLMKNAFDIINQLSGENRLCRAIYEMMVEAYPKETFEASLDEVVLRALHFSSKGCTPYAMDNIDKQCDVLRVVWNELQTNKYLKSKVTINTTEMRNDVLSKVLQGATADIKCSFKRWESCTEGMASIINCNIENRITQIILLHPSMTHKSPRQARKQMWLPFNVEIRDEDGLIYSDAFSIFPITEDVLKETRYCVSEIINEALIFIMKKELGE